MGIGSVTLPVRIPGGRSSTLAEQVYLQIKKAILTCKLKPGQMIYESDMIQEFGVYNKTPHDVTVAYLTDVVSVFNQKHLGYAMWNMIGTMGIINSGRSDMTYEPYRGKLLDRELTNIMQSSGR